MSLVGDGFEEVPYLLAGAMEATSGILEVGGHTVQLPAAGVREVMRAGVGLVPGNRETQGAVMALPIRTNVTLPRIETTSGDGSCNWGARSVRRVNYWRSSMCDPSPRTEHRPGP